MSKLYNKYTELKSNDPEKLYLFKSGIFYIFLDSDANLVASHLNLKLTKLNDSILKCGFPVSNITKYSSMLKEYGFDFEIVDDNLNVNSPNPDYLNNIDITNKLNKIKNMDINKVSPLDAFNILYDLKSIL